MAPSHSTIIGLVFMLWTPSVIIYLQLCPLKSPSVTSDISADKASNNSTGVSRHFKLKRDCNYRLFGWTKTVRCRRACNNNCHTALSYRCPAPEVPFQHVALSAAPPCSAAALTEGFFLPPAPRPERNTSLFRDQVVKLESSWQESQQNVSALS